MHRRLGGTDLTPKFSKLHEAGDGRRNLLAVPNQWLSSPCVVSDWLVWPIPIWPPVRVVNLRALFAIVTPRACEEAQEPSQHDVIHIRWH